MRRVIYPVLIAVLVAVVVLLAADVAAAATIRDWAPIVNEAECTVMTSGAPVDVAIDGETVAMLKPSTGNTYTNQGPVIVTVTVYMQRDHTDSRSFLFDCMEVPPSTTTPPGDTTTTTTPPPATTIPPTTQPPTTTIPDTTTTTPEDPTPTTTAAPPPTVTGPPSSPPSTVSPSLSVPPTTATETPINLVPPGRLVSVYPPAPAEELPATGPGVDLFPFAVVGSLLMAAGAWLVFANRTG